MTQQGYDVVVVGGGIMGSAIAYFLAAEPTYDGTVLVVEKDPTYAEASTTLSSGGIRQQFSTPENIQICQFGVEFIKSAHQHLSVDGEAPQIGFVEAGYLFIANDGGVPVMRSSHQIQRQHGADVVLLTPAEIADRFPWLNVDDVALGSFGQTGEGWLDPYALLQAFRRKARDLGVTYVKDEAVGMEMDGGRVAAVRLKEGGRVPCGVVVNGAGAKAAGIAAMAGIELPVRPRKRTTFYYLCATPLPRCPMVIESFGVAGLHFRPEGNGYIGGIAPPIAEDHDAIDLDVDYSHWEDRVWPLLANRVPAFAEVKMVRAWAGLFEVNTLDQNAILGPHPEVENFFFINGFSGHGLQQAAGAGRSVAELIAFGAYRTLDLGRFSFDRIVSGEPVQELAVV